MMKRTISALMAILLVFGGLRATVVFANTTVSTRQAVQVTSTSARIIGDWRLQDQSFTVLELGVLISTNQHDITANIGTRVPTFNFSGNSFEVDLTNLQPGVEYFVKAYVRYRVGGSVFAQERTSFDPSFIRFTTSGVAGISLTRPQATISGTNTTLETTVSAQGAQVSSRGFAISPTNATPVIGGANTTIAAATQHTNTWFTSTSTGISQGRRYFVRAFIQLANGQIIYSETLILDGGQGSGNTAFQGVNTRIATFSNLVISMRGSFNTSQFTNITERGFVVSSANSTPTTSSGTRVLSATNLETNQDNIAADWTIGSTASVYYVRSYIINSGTPHYGNVIRVEIGTDTPVVFTRSASVHGENQARVTIDVVRAGRSGIIERGIVYSDTVADPQNLRANVQSRSVAGTLGEGEVTITGIVPGTRYFIRAFARNEHGTSYGQVVELLAVPEGAVQTLAPTNTSQNTITARASISGINQAIIREMGFIYSATNATPSRITNDTRVSTTAASLGEFSLGVSGLQANTTYYLRAFITTDTGTIYGNVVTFSTSIQQTQLTINFQTAAGQNVGSQQLGVQAGQSLTASSLQLPQGHALANPNWSHTVEADKSSIIVTVNPTQQAETAFISGTGNMTFSPGRATTRAEVAQVIYNLSPTRQINNPMTFSDVGQNHPNRRAIDYVSSRLHMRGYPDGSFRPEATITRAEVTVVLSNVYNLINTPPPAGAGTANFSDVNQSFWGQRYIAAAFAHRMIYGYPDGTFLPNNNITRAEVTTLFVNAEGRSRQPLGTAQFTDVPQNHWAFSFIMNASVPH